MITREDCKEMRRLNEEGLSTREIGDRFGRSRGSVRWHVSEKCSHGEERPEPLPGEREEARRDVEQRLRREIRHYLAHTGDHIGARVMVDALRDDISTSGAGDEAKDENGGQMSDVKRTHVLPKECARIRRVRQESDFSLKEIGEHFGRCEDTICTHATGRCDHSTPNGNSNPREAIDAEHCEEIRTWRREGASFKDIVEQSTISESALRRHIQGECSHYDGHDPLLEDVRESIRDHVDERGGSWIVRTPQIADQDDVAASQKQLKYLIEQARDGDDPLLTAEKWGGKRSPWVIERRDEVATDGGEE